MTSDLKKIERRNKELIKSNEELNKFINKMLQNNEVEMRETKEKKNKTVEVQNKQTLKPTNDDSAKAQRKPNSSGIKCQWENCVN